MLNQQNIELLEDFKQYIEVKNYRTKMRTLVQPIEEFLSWIQQRGIWTITEVNNSILRDYYQYLSNRPNQTRGGVLSDSSINNHLHALKILNERLLESRVLPIGMLIPNRVNATHIERQALTVEEIKELYATSESQLERTILGLSYGCGLRRSEIAELEVSDLKLSESYLIVHKGKGGKRREVPMSEAIVKDIREYLIGERKDALTKNKKISSYVMVSKWGRRIKGDVLNKKLKEQVKRTQNQQLLKKKVSLHSMRHSIATHLLENGATMEFVRTFLGHSELDTSHIYARRRKRHNVFRV